MDEVLKRIIDLIGPKHGASKLLADHLGIHPNVITNWKNGRNKSYRGYLPQIADYFGVSVDYLLGNEEKTPANTGERVISDDDIMFALWGDTTDVDEDDLDDVKRYAAFVRERKKKK